MASNGLNPGPGQGDGNAGGARGWRERLSAAPKRIIAAIVGIPAFAAGAVYLLPIIPAIVSVGVECDASGVVVRVRNWGGRTMEVGTPRFELKSPARYPEAPDRFQYFDLSDLPNPVTDENRQIGHFSAERYPYRNRNRQPLFDPSELQGGATVRVTVPYDQALGRNTSKSSEATCAQPS